MRSEREIKRKASKLKIEARKSLNGLILTKKGRRRSGFLWRVESLIEKVSSGLSGLVHEMKFKNHKIGSFRWEFTPKLLFQLNPKENGFIDF